MATSREGDVFSIPSTSGLTPIAMGANCAAEIPHPGRMGGIEVQELNECTRVAHANGARWTVHGGAHSATRK